MTGSRQPSHSPFSDDENRGTQRGLASDFADIDEGSDNDKENENGNNLVEEVTNSSETVKHEMSLADIIQERNKHWNESVNSPKKASFQPLSNDFFSNNTDNNNGSANAKHDNADNADNADNDNDDDNHNELKTDEFNNVPTKQSDGNSPPPPFQVSNAMAIDMDANDHDHDLGNDDEFQFDIEANDEDGAAEEDEDIEDNDENLLSPGLLASTLKRENRAWIDDWEAGITDTFYHRQMSTLRPTYQTVQRTVSGLNMDFFEPPNHNGKGSRRATQKTLKNRHNKNNPQNRYKMITDEHAHIEISEIPPLSSNSRLSHDSNADTPLSSRRRNNAGGEGQKTNIPLQSLDEHNIDDDSDEASVNADDIELENEEKEQQQKSRAQKKFGPWDGVMAGCLLNIFGVIMFLRVGWIVGQAGIIETLVIIGISCVVTTLTALSMSAICTNGAILGGGAYYLISRALGPAVGGSVGILFSLGNMVAVAMYLIGFAETLTTNLMEGSGFSLTGDYVNDVRVWSNIVLIFELILALIGLKYVIKTQLFLLAFISVSILCFFAGSFYRTKDNSDGEQVLYGVDGWTNSNVATNTFHGYADGYDFWSTLAIFFPAVTGIMAGANISGDLKNASSDIPKGTITAIIISTIVYSIMAIFVGAVARRSELLENNLVMTDICISEYIILVGIYAATLSSGIASLVGAPRILMKVAEDDIFPCLRYFAKADKDGNPIRGYFLSFAVAAACNCIGSLNTVAPLISEFFMIAYLLINFSCFAMEISKSPGWRPSFRYFNKWTALAGAIFCLVVMFLLEWRYALAAVVIGYGLYMYIKWRDPQVNWGSAYESRIMWNAYKTVLQLRKRKQHIKNWRPGFLVLCKNPVSSPALVMFSRTLRKSHGPIFIATIHTGDYRRSISKFRAAHYDGYLPTDTPNQSLNKMHSGFYEAILAQNFRTGVQTLLQTAGMGNIRPNTLLIGFLKKTNLAQSDLVCEYVQILRDSLLMNVNIIICCGFKRINWMNEHFRPLAVNTDVEAMTTMEGIRDCAQKKRYRSADNIVNQTKFDAKLWTEGQKQTIIDVWWMVDDGGFVMLLPYILRLHTFWSECKLRLNIVANANSLCHEIVAMKKMIHKFRLPYEEPRLIPVQNDNPMQATVDRFECLAQCSIDETPRPNVTMRWLKLSELLFTKSRYAGLIVVTMPIPTKAFQPSAYMAILKMLSDQQRLPPTIIMRGNGAQTLTFYQE